MKNLEKQNKRRNTDDSSLKIFKIIALNQIPRILGLGDREEQSPTFGCFDRYYWHYKIIDFPNARFQEAVLLMALVYKYNLSSRFYRKSRLFKWILGGIEFWKKIQNKDGSFSEVYPFERSFCATSFSTLAMVETCLLMKRELPLGEILPTLKKAGHWLSENNNIKVANQMAGAALALTFLYLLTNESYWKKAALRKVELLLAQRGNHNYFPEYGGYDIGYSSLSLSCLSRVEKWLEHRELRNSLGILLKKLEEDIKNDGSFEYSKTSRRTQYLYPLGFVLLKSKVIDFMVSGLKKNAIINPAWLDDRYTISLTIDYLQAVVEGGEV